MELHLELFHLKELMESTVKMIKPMVDEKRLELQMNLAENLGMMYAERARIMLPKKDGWEVMQILKKEEVTRDIPIIIYYDGKIGNWDFTWEQ